jgi:hypothetical protein
MRVGKGCCSLLRMKANKTKTLQNRDVKGLISVVGTEALVPY